MTLKPYGISEEEVKRKITVERQLQNRVGVIDLPCYRLTVEPSEGHPWNGWVRRWREAPFKETPDDVDRWLPGGCGISSHSFYLSTKDPASFESGSYWYAVEHLYLCDTCIIMDELVKAGQFPSRSEAIRQMAVIGLVEYAKRKWAV